LLLPNLHASEKDLVKLIPDLVAFWTFGEATGQNRIDEISGYSLTDGHTDKVTRIEGGPFSGYAAYFNGSSNYLTIPNSQLGDLDIAGDGAEVTVVSWIKREETGTSFIAGIWQEDNDDPRRQYGLFIDLPAYGGDENVCGHVSFTGGASPDIPYSRDYSANQTAITNGEWSTVAFTFDGTYARSYLNSKFEERSSYTEPEEPLGQGLTYAKNPYYFPDGLGSNGGNFTVGAVLLTWGMYNHFEGAIGGLAIFNRALSAEELFLLHCTSLDTDEAAAEFTFLNESGSNVGVSKHAWKAFGNATNTASGWLLGGATALDGEGGYLAKIQTGQTGIAWTEAIPAIPNMLIERVEFTLNNAAKADTLHLALKTGGEWYASSSPYAVTSDGLTASDWSYAETKTVFFNRDTATWLSLTFNASDTLELSSAPAQKLPAGSLEAIGFYQPANTNTVRIDNVKVFVSLDGLDASTYALWALNNNVPSNEFDEDDDPDFDGLSNLQEYAMGGNPIVANTSAEVTTTQVDASYLNIYTERRKFANVTIQPQISTTLSSWDDATDVEIELLSEASTDNEFIESLQWRVIASGPKQFMRFKITAP
jgi:hypothetical protein